MALIVLIGASGSGKTSIAEQIQAHHADVAEVFRFDSIGVPTSEEMIASYGSGEAWQLAMTIEWFRKLAALDPSQRGILFEGQTRISFLAEASSSVGGMPYVPILVDCDDETRIRRLVMNRRQPELANDNMLNWARYLKNEALRAGCEILDTSSLSLEESVRCVVQRLMAARTDVPTVGVQTDGTAVAISFPYDPTVVAQVVQQ